MNAPNKRGCDTDILETLSKRPVPTRSRRNTFGRNLVNPGEYDIADEIRDRRSRELRSPSGSGRAGVQTSMN